MNSWFFCFSVWTLRKYLFSIHKNPFYVLLKLCISIDFISFLGLDNTQGGIWENSFTLTWKPFKFSFQYNLTSSLLFIIRETERNIFKDLFTTSSFVRPFQKLKVFFNWLFFKYLFKKELISANIYNKKVISITFLLVTPRYSKQWININTRHMAFNLFPFVHFPTIIVRF